MVRGPVPTKDRSIRPVLVRDLGDVIFNDLGRRQHHRISMADLFEFYGHHTREEVRQAVDRLVSRRLARVTSGRNFLVRRFHYAPHLCAACRCKMHAGATQEAAGWQREGGR